MKAEDQTEELHHPMLPRTGSSLFSQCKKNLFRTAINISVKIIVRKGYQISEQEKHILQIVFDTYDTFKILKPCKISIFHGKFEEMTSAKKTEGK